MDPLTSCPFDPSHRGRRSKIQWHLYKCSKNHSNHKKVQCPFDTTHILDAVELDHHKSVCPSSRNVMCFKYCLEQPTQVGTVSVEEACAKEPKLCDEDWSGDHPKYDPYAACNKKAFVRPLISGSKAKKREYKRAERERVNTILKTQDEKLYIRKETELDKPLRRPKNAAKALLDKTRVKATDANIDDLVSKFQDISTTEDNANETAALSTSFSSKQTSQKEDHDKYYKKEENNNLNEKNISIEKSEILYSNPRCAAKFSESMMARKHSAGRGFAIKCQWAN